MELWNAGNAKPQKWYRKPLDGCVNGGGKPYSISLKRGTVNRLLVNFVGGGGSWSEYTAARPITVGTALMKKEGYYISDISPSMLSLMHVGILDAKDKRNRFCDWHVLNIPYTTADFHLGNSEYPYKDGKGVSQTLYHHGAKNVTAAIEVLKELVSGTPEILVIMGLSAGGFGCVAHAPRICGLYPLCKNVIVYSEAAHIHSPRWADIASDVWKVSPDLAAYIKSGDLIYDLFRYARDNMPPHTLFLHSNSVWDGELALFMNKMNHDKGSIDPPALLEFNNTLINVVKKLKSDMINYSYYLTDYGRSKKNGTTPHTFCGAPKLLYGKTQDGMSVASWLRLAVVGKPVDIGRKLLP